MKCAKFAVIDRIAAVRKLRRLTYRAFAAKTGLALSTVYEMENDYCSPKVETLLKVCLALDVSADYLLGLKEEMK